MTRMQLRCSPDQKERWERAAGGAGSLSAWIRDVLDRAAAATESGMTSSVRADADATAPDSVSEEKDPDTPGPSLYDLHDGDVIRDRSTGAAFRVYAENPGGTPSRSSWSVPLRDGDELEDAAGRVFRVYQVEDVNGAVGEEPVGTNGDEPGPVSGEPGGSSSTLTEEGGVNHSSSDHDGQEMSPLPSGENDRSSRTSASTSPPAVSAAVPAPIQAASLDIVVQRLFPGVKTEDLMAEYESTDHEFNDFLGWLTWRHEQDVINDVDTFFEPVKLTDAQRRQQQDRRSRRCSTTGSTPMRRHCLVRGGSLTTTRTPNPKTPLISNHHACSKRTAPARPTLSPVCVNAAMHWKLVAGETCRYCGGTL
jgi:hypothetical protein